MYHVSYNERMCSVYSSGWGCFCNSWGSVWRRSAIVGGRFCLIWQWRNAELKINLVTAVQFGRLILAVASWFWTEQKNQKMADLEGNPFSDPEGINPFAVSPTSVGVETLTYFVWGGGCKGCAGRSCYSMYWEGVSRLGQVECVSKVLWHCLMVALITQVWSIMMLWQQRTVLLLAWAECKHNDSL